MKKLFSLIVLGMLCLSASAQFQDMVTLQDTDVYMIPTKPAKISARESYHACGTLPVGIFVQQYVPQDSVVVYGIALTINSWGGSDTIYKNPHYTAVMMQRPPGGHDSAFLSLNYRKLKYVDSVRLDSAFVDGASVKYSKFRYEFDLPNSYYSIVPCYEFYFAAPKVMTDTFYVGRKYREENDTINPASEYSGLYQITPVVPHSFWYSGAPSGWPLDTAEFLEQPGANAPYHYWGFSFPIIGFHCRPLDEENHSLLLTDITDNGATVHWYSVEEGATYNVRVSSVDGSVDTIVVTTDSSYTFSGLPTNTRYTVQVRKQCYYATASYDTTVYSPWTTVNTCFVLGCDTCPPVSNVLVAPMGTSATVSWGNSPCYSHVSLRYGTLNQQLSEWQEVDVSGDSLYIITDLTPGTRYGVAMQALCEYLDQETPWSEPEIFYVADTSGGGTGIATVDGVDFAVSPNPVHGLVEVTLPQPLATEGILSMHDIGGREVCQTVVPAGSQRVTLDTEGCAAGAYLLRLTTPQGIATRRLLVE